MGRLNLTLQAVEIRRASLDENLVFLAMPQLAIPDIYRVHFRQNVYTRRQFILYPAICLLSGTVAIGPEGNYTISVVPSVFRLQTLKTDRLTTSMRNYLIHLVYSLILAQLMLTVC